MTPRPARCTCAYPMPYTVTARDGSIAVRCTRCHAVLAEVRSDPQPARIGQAPEVA